MAYAREIVQAGISPGSAIGLGGNYAAITAAGSSITDAARLTASICVVGSADGTKGVYLQGEVGDEVWVFNNSGSTLKVYGDTSSVAITVSGTGLGTAGTAFSHLTYKSAVYKKMTTTQWMVIVSA